jgi:hypothetical protein
MRSSGDAPQSAARLRKRPFRLALPLWTKTGRRNGRSAECCSVGIQKSHDGRPGLVALPLRNGSIILAYRSGGFRIPHQSRTADRPAGRLPGLESPRDAWRSQLLRPDGATLAFTLPSTTSRTLALTVHAGDPLDWLCARYRPAAGARGGFRTWAEGGVCLCCPPRKQRKPRTTARFLTTTT